MSFLKHKLWATLGKKNKTTFEICPFLTYLCQNLHTSQSISFTFNFLRSSRTHLSYGASSVSTSALCSRTHAKEKWSLYSLFNRKKTRKMNPSCRRGTPPKKKTKHKKTKQKKRNSCCLTSWEKKRLHASMGKTVDTSLGLCSA